ncbi:MAG TPA: asparaginase [Solirubrobacterales bacterium]|nr:asparaginase [Solirubrobacterales bacterium]
MPGRQVGTRVLLLSLGGTIAMTPGERGGVTPTLGGDDLIAAVPGLAEVAAIEAESFRTIPGAHLSFEDLGALARRIEASAEQGFDGVVVTQGTDTLEETSFLLDLLTVPERRLVLTGAMRNPSLAGADGPANLLAAVRLAACPAAAGLGATVVLGDEIHAARYVRKAHTQSPAAFRSLAGPVGWIGEGAVRIALRPPPSPALKLSAAGDRRVALLTAALDDGGGLLDAARGRADGIVVEALGGGHLPLPWLEAIEEAAAAMPVVYASRTGAGEVLTETYGFPGSETDLRERGAIPAGWLDGPKARILLTLLLRAGADPGSARDSFARYLAGAAVS